MTVGSAWRERRRDRGGSRGSAGTGEAARAKRPGRSGRLGRSGPGSIPGHPGATAGLTARRRVGGSAPAARLIVAKRAWQSTPQGRTAEPQGRTAENTVSGHHTVPARHAVETCGPWRRLRVSSVAWHAHRPGHRDPGQHPGSRRFATSPISSPISSMRLAIARRHRAPRHRAGSGSRVRHAVPVLPRDRHPGRRAAPRPPRG